MTCVAIQLFISSLASPSQQAVAKEGRHAATGCPQGESDERGPIPSAEAWRSVVGPAAAASVVQQRICGRLKGATADSAFDEQLNCPAGGEDWAAEEDRQAVWQGRTGRDREQHRILAGDCAMPVLRMPVLPSAGHDWPPPAKRAVLASSKERAGTTVVLHDGAVLSRADFRHLLSFLFHRQKPPFALLTLSPKLLPRDCDDDDDDSDATSTVAQYSTAPFPYHGLASR